MARVAVFFATGYEEIEALTVVDLLRRAGIDTETVSISNERAVTGRSGISTITDKLFEDVDFNSIEAIVLPGGMPGTNNLEVFDPLTMQVDNFVNGGQKIVAAICAGPKILGRRGLLKGKNACCYPGVEDQLLGAITNEEPVTVDGNIITSRGLGTAIDFALAIIEKLTNSATADKIADSVVYIRPVAEAE